MARERGQLTRQAAMLGWASALELSAGQPWGLLQPSVIPCRVGSLLVSLQPLALHFLAQD